MKAIVSIILISLLSFQAYSSTENKIPIEKIERYMELSGIDESMSSMPVQIDAMQKQSLLTSENPDAEKAVMQLLIDAWDYDEIQNSIINHVQHASDEQEINALLTWYEGPLASKFVAAELESTSPNFQNNLLRYIADLQVAPPSAETIQAIRRLVVTTDMAEMMVEMIIQMSRAMMNSFMAAGIAGQDVSPSDINKQIDFMRAALKPAMEEQSILMSYYLYRNISNEDLNDYSSFYESSLGKKELKLVSTSLSAAMSLWAKQSATAIIESLANESLNFD